MNDIQQQQNAQRFALEYKRKIESMTSRRDEWTNDEEFIKAVFGEFVNTAADFIIAEIIAEIKNAP